MVDVTILGSGAAAQTCGEVLYRAGFKVNRALDLEAGDHTPVILGECNGAFAIARQAIESGRHLMIAAPGAISAERLALLFADRKRAQSIFIWNERRYHPGYRFVNSLTETDATWRPRYLRLETLCTEPTNSALVRLRTLEAIALLLSITSESPVEVSGLAEANPMRNAPDLIALRLVFAGLEAFIQVGMGEAIERRETLLAAANRKAYVDELNQSMPLRLVEDDSRPAAGPQARWLSCPPPGPEEMARQQCLAFLDATLKTNLAQAEASLWLRSIAVLQATDRSLQADGAPAPVEVGEEQPRFRVILGRSFAASPHSVA
ncbi:MAG: hypothetical protein GEU75_10940 [Dehalococcoidia bacterium]|nr:hypothetical protein [Dehalococcoidia bacterium]